MLRALVVDDEALARRNVTVLLRGDPDIEVAAIKPAEAHAPLDRAEIKEKDLDNRLAPTDIPGEPRLMMPDPPQGKGVDQELQKDFQLRRAVELLQSLTLLQERGMTMIK